MKKIIQLILLVIALHSFNQASAQTSGKRFSFGFGFEGGVVLSDADFKEAFSSEAGISLRFSVKAGPGYVTFSPGALVVIPKKISEDDLKVGTRFPLRIGYKYIFAGKFFVMGEAGYAAYTLYTANTEDEGENIIKEKSGGFTYAPSVGVNLGKFEAGVRYETTVLKDSDAKSGILGLRLGFNF